MSYPLPLKTLPQNLVIANNKIYYLTVSVGQKSRSGLPGWFWLRISHQATIKMLAKAAVTLRFNWRWLYCQAHSHGFWWTPEDLLPSSLMVVSPRGCRMT